MNQGIGQARADEIAAIFGLDKSKVLTPEQYSLLTSGGGVGGNLSDALRDGAFTVLDDPVPVETMLQALERVVRRHYRDHWPAA